jgi:hypothetical protein
MRATALLFARSRALVRPASRGIRDHTASRPPHPLYPQMRAPEYRSEERLLWTSRNRLDPRRTGARFARAERKRPVTLPLPSLFRAGARRWWTSSARGACARP